MPASREGKKRGRCTGREEELLVRALLFAATDPEKDGVTGRDGETKERRGGGGDRDERESRRETKGSSSVRKDKQCICCEG